MLLEKLRKTLSFLFIHQQTLGKNQAFGDGVGEAAPEAGDLRAGSSGTAPLFLFLLRRRRREHSSRASVPRLGESSWVQGASNKPKHGDDL